jgi:hypothetical protein
LVQPVVGFHVRSVHSIREALVMDLSVTRCAYVLQPPPLTDLQEVHGVCPLVMAIFPAH